eukprot:COSAG02_NODE_40441_length_405_cov_1.323529_1_plen_100_part_01
MAGLRRRGARPLQQLQLLASHCRLALSSWYVRLLLRLLGLADDLHYPMIDCTVQVDGSFHSATGEVLINETLFPDMLKMNRFAHAKNVKMGWCALFPTSM